MIVGTIANTSALNYSTSNTTANITNGLERKSLISESLLSKTTTSRTTSLESNIEIYVFEISFTYFVFNWQQLLLSLALALTLEAYYFALENQVFKNYLKTS